MTHSQIMQMSKEELRFAVAEAFGWRPLKKISTGQLLGRNNKHGGWKCVPDYTACLNACREMEETLSGPQQLAYIGELSNLDCYVSWNAIRATAEQRCRAFLLATQKEAE